MIIYIISIDNYYEIKKINDIINTAYNKQKTQDEYDKYLKMDNYKLVDNKRNNLIIYILK